MRKVMFFSVLFLTVVVAQAQLRLMKTITVTTTAEGGSARPEVVVPQGGTNRVFVLYLGNIVAGSNRTFNLKIYDSNLDTVIVTRILVSTTTEYGSPTDIRITSDGQYLYAFYETYKTNSPTSHTTYLWGAKYTLDDNFDRVAYTFSPITSSHPMSELQDGGELLDDPAPLLGPDTVFVITRLKYSISMSGPTIYRVRGFNKNDLTQLLQFDLDLSNVANGRGRVTSLLLSNDRIHMALATTVSDSGINENVDDGAKSDIMVVRMHQDWTFDPQNDVHTVSAEPSDVENYVCGFETDSSYFYITYKQSVGTPPSGEHRAWIKVLDGNFHLVSQQNVRSTVWGPGGGELRPSLEVQGSRIFSGQSAGESLGSGNAKIYLYESSAARMSFSMISGWNLLSVPLLPLDNRKLILYPTAKSDAYTYTKKYITDDTLDCGTGYWIKFAETQHVDIIGWTISHDTIAVNKGWNMIGSISTPGLVSSITADPSDLTRSQVWRYDGSKYQTSDTIEPGVGYWVKVSKAGRLFLTASQLSQPRLMKVVDDGEMPPPPPSEDNVVTTGYPTQFRLEQNYPNPFNPETDVRYAMRDVRNVNLRVYDVLGREVATLVDEVKEPGEYTVRWDATGLSSGVYLLSMKATGVNHPTSVFEQVQKLVLMK